VIRWLRNLFRYLRGTISTESQHAGKRSLQVGHAFDNSQITGKPQGIFPRVNANEWGRHQKKSQRCKKLTAGAKAQKYFRRLNDTTDVVPSQCRSGEVRSLDSRGRAVPTRTGYPGSALEWLHGERLYLRGLRGMERDHGG